MRAKAIVAFTFLLLLISSGQAATQRVLYAFNGLDGSGPYAAVIFDSAGNLYGVTEAGGIYGKGTVFQLSPAGGVWNESVLYNFTGGTDGDEPIGGLAIDAAGNLYGTTLNGGDLNAQCGTVFALSKSGGTWTFSLLHTFTGGQDGCGPGSNLLYQNGTLTGTTVGGGPNNQGTSFYIFSGTNYRVTERFSGKNGSQPWGTTTAAGGGYGTTYLGGSAGQGNVYELLYQNHVKAIHQFKSTNKAGYHPLGDLLTGVENGAPTMSGTNYSGGVGGSGTAYRLTESQVQYDVWALSVLHSFSGPDGASPGAGMISDSAGRLYGTTVFGGGDPGYAGTVFMLTPGPKVWTHTLLYSFTGGTDGGNIYSGLVRDSVGNLYGTALNGGAHGQGVVYEVSP